MPEDPTDHAWAEVVMKPTMAMTAVVMVEPVAVVAVVMAVNDAIEDGIDTVCGDGRDRHGEGRAGSERGPTQRQGSDHRRS